MPTAPSARRVLSPPRPPPPHHKSAHAGTWARASSGGLVDGGTGTGEPQNRPGGSWESQDGGALPAPLCLAWPQFTGSAWDQSGSQQTAPRLRRSQTGTEPVLSLVMALLTLVPGASAQIPLQRLHPSRPVAHPQLAATRGAGQPGALKVLTSSIRASLSPQGHPCPSVWC